MDLKEKTVNDKRHPWELSRTKNLLNVFEKYVGDKKHLFIADIGAGDMYFDEQLIKSLKDEKIDSTIFAIDKGYDELISEKSEIVMLNDVQELKKDSIDCIFLMDVLEHIEDDTEFLELVSERLKRNGIIIMTVPAFQSLYSYHDTFLSHYRRYEYSQLKDFFHNMQFEVLQSHYFYVTLFFARWFQLRFTRNKEKKEDTGIGMWGYGKDHVITKCIESTLNIDFYINELFNKLGIRLPGLSLLVVARK